MPGYVFTGLQRKIDAAKRRMEAQRPVFDPKTPVKSFNKDDHLPDGTIKPRKKG